MKNNPEKTAWRLRNKLSYPEKIFKEILEVDNRFNKFNVIREKCIFPYYVDFAFIDNNIAIEIDGSQHEKNKKYDNKRDNYIMKKGWRIFRIKAKQLYDKNSKENVLLELLNFIGNIVTKKRSYDIITESDLKKIAKEQKRIFKIKEHNNLIQKRYDSLKYLNKYKGYIKKCKKDWNISHTQVIRFVKKYYKFVDNKFIII